jgi:hypothetical protein
LLFFSLIRLGILDKLRFYIAARALSVTFNGVKEHSDGVSAADSILSIFQVLVIALIIMILN